MVHPLPTRKVDDLVLLIGGAGDLGASKRFYVERGLHAFSTLLAMAGMTLNEGDYCFAVLHRFPLPQPIEPMGRSWPCNGDARAEQGSRGQ